jgi:hypothetical protein
MIKPLKKTYRLNERKYNSLENIEFSKNNTIAIVTE